MICYYCGKRLWFWQVILRVELWPFFRITVIHRKCKKGYDGQIAEHMKEPFKTEE